MLDVNVGSLDFYNLRLIDENGQFQEYNLEELLKVNEDNYMQEMIEQPAKYIYWSSVLERLKYFQESAELELETTVASLDQEAREYLKDTVPKPTKDMVESYIKRQPTYKSAKDKEIQYNYIVGRVQRIVKAFEQRKDMLQSYGKQVIDNQQYGRGAGSTLMYPSYNPPNPNQ
ncbi:recombination mediator protein [Bacillus phage 278BB001]|nr:recombination mediator protein [Bacillus phage 043JT007]QZA70286.1 recombination mediator protein [Bacillus phage 278BB001]